MYKKPRSATFSPQSQFERLSSSNNSRQRGSSLASNNIPSERTTGIIEKLLNNYGFIECCDQDARIFFHYSEVEEDEENLQVGDCMEFSITVCPRSKKPIAVHLKKMPLGAFSFETLTDTPVVGRVEHEARPASKSSKNGDSSEQAIVGQASYDRNGEVFFLSFTFRDVEKGITVKKGDKISFHVATDKRNGSLKARKIVLLESCPDNLVQGIVSSLKDTFGFIERADKVAEIFFHYSEFQGKIEELMISDDVEFALQERGGKMVAVQVRQLAHGSVVLEDVSEERFKGRVIKPISSKQTMRSTFDGPMNGIIEVQMETDTKELMFGDRDTEDGVALQRGDVVEFNISTDRRDNLQRAVNIKLVKVSVKNGQVRETGVINSLKDGFGFIRCADRDLSLFFRFNEVLEQTHILNVGDEVEFTLEEEPFSKRLQATRIRFLTKGTVDFGTTSKERYQGVIEKLPTNKKRDSFSGSVRESEDGVIDAVIDGEHEKVSFRHRDCRARDSFQYGDLVEFNLITLKRNGHKAAKDIMLVKKAEYPREQGCICVLKESFGFIEFANHQREVFFHFSELDCDPSDVNLGDEVEFSWLRKSGKPCAERVTRLTPGSIPREEPLEGILHGVITRPLRIVDPEQEEYEGLVRVTPPSDEDKTENGYHGDVQEYPYSFTSLVNKRDPLQVGDKVTFELGRDPVSNSLRAIKISCTRDEVRGKVESIKGQFGFIAHETEEGKNLFFHMSEVDDDGRDLAPGDTVSFVIVKSHKNAKPSAVKVKRISESPRPDRLVRKTDYANGNGKKFMIIRQPTGPDGTAGFKLVRGRSLEKSKKEETDPETQEAEQATERSAVEEEQA